MASSFHRVRPVAEYEIASMAEGVAWFRRQLDAEAPVEERFTHGVVRGRSTRERRGRPALREPWREREVS
jgi:hypothetical protein